MSKPRTTNRQRVLELLQAGPQTTLDMRAAGVLSPAPRVYELRKAGWPVQSRIVAEPDQFGRTVGVAIYWLGGAA